jgi:hypothetical protein
MHAVVRTYSGAGATELFDLLGARQADIEALLRSVKGFRSYALVRTPTGGFSVTVADDKAATDESTRRASEFIRENAPGSTAAAPTILEGPVLIEAYAAGALS